jgi:hypothetical protein
VGSGGWPPTPNPQSPIPNPQSPFQKKFSLFELLNLKNKTLKIKYLTKNIIVYPLYISFKIN